MAPQLESVRLRILRAWVVPMPGYREWVEHQLRHVMSSPGHAFASRRVTYYACFSYLMGLGSADTRIMDACRLPSRNPDAQGGNSLNRVTHSILPCVDSPAF